MTVGVWIRWIFWFCSVFTLNTTNVFKMERFTFKSGEFSFPTLLVIISHSKKSSNRQKYIHTTNLLLKPLICRKSHAVTPKCQNFYGANFEFSPFLAVIVFWLYLFYQTFKITIYSVRPLPSQIIQDKNFQFSVDINHLNKNTIFLWLKIMI